ncbi:hypothetical protein LEP3755_19120 [Leptolyngbya sp. NIES-3755]|nr:hypothetical protein LEP3755_19120 [Leptolyngbya sp. NIES-3755]
MRILRLLGLLLPLCILSACTQPSNSAASHSQASAQVAAKSFTWIDRRPIGTMFLSNGTAYTPNNPRKWLNARDLDLSTAAGKEEFRKRMIALANFSITHLKQIDAQGVLVFDIEGGEAESGEYTWVGDPRLVGERAPEMEEIADEFFQTFKKAGFRVGVTIRAQFMFPYPTPLPRRWWEKDKNLARYWSYRTDEEAIEGISKKIAYARKRWGATLFYIDSNNEKALSVIEKLQQKFPDTLLIPEHTGKNPAYLGFSAPLERVDRWKYDLNTEHRKQHPSGFKAILIRNPKQFEKLYQQSLYDYLLPKVQAGDLLMINVWYPDEYHEVVRKLYRTAYGDRCCTWNPNNRRL